MAISTISVVDTPQASRREANRLTTDNPHRTLSVELQYHGHTDRSNGVSTNDQVDEDARIRPHHVAFVRKHCTTEPHSYRTYLDCHSIVCVTGLCDRGTEALQRVCCVDCCSLACVPFVLKLWSVHSTDKRDGNPGVDSG